MTGGSEASLSPGTPTAPLLPLLQHTFTSLRVPAFIHVSLDAVAHNVDVLKGMCGPNTELMGVVKGGAYGSGLMAVVEVLVEKGVKELAVATVAEGVYLRNNDVTLPITVLGNLITNELSDVLQHRLIPSLSWAKALTQVSPDSLVYPDGARLEVAVNIDTGMSRYGVQPGDVADLVDQLDHLNVTLRAMYTHFQSAITEPAKNQRQLDLYLQTTEPYRDRGIQRHVAATTGCVQGLATDLDFIRPGGAITGLCSGSDPESTEMFAKRGFKPALSVVAQASFVKLLDAGRDVGYDGTYTTQEPQWIANFTTGWSDGLNRRLSNIGAVRRLKTGETCPIVGRVSMDSITVRLPAEPDADEVFQILSDDFSEVTSAVGMARLLGGATYEMPGNWSTRLPRVYTRDYKLAKVCCSFDYTC